MAPLKEVECDDEDISLKQLKEKLRSNKKKDDDIPLNILAKSIKKNHMTMRGKRILNAVIQMA